MSERPSLLTFPDRREPIRIFVPFFAFIPRFKTVVNYLMEETTFFQTLTDDELHNIVRSDAFDCKQAVHFWKSSIFSRCAPYLFRKIRLDYNERSMGNYVTGEIVLGHDSNFEETLRMCGPVFTSLRINASVPPVYTEEDLLCLRRLFKDGNNLSLRAVLHLSCTFSRYWVRHFKV